MKTLSCRITATSILKKNCLALLVGVALSSSVHAQQASAKTQYAISSRELVQVINEISRRSGLQIVYDIDALQGIKAADVKGNLTVQQALDKALKGTNLSWTQVNPTTISIKKKTLAPQRPSQDVTNIKPPSVSSGSVDSGRDVQELEKMVVVGSRLGALSPVESALPIKVISREEIDRSNASTIAQVLANLSEVSVNNSGDLDIGSNAFETGERSNSTTVQMRGLPRGTTLVLINGRRAVESSSSTLTGQFDLSTIPLSMVDRIEVLPAGASASYGGDGLAGVVNIVLRRDASGTEMRLRHTSADSYSEKDMSIVWGKAWSRGNITATASWRETGALENLDRSLTADQDFRRFGGRDTRASVGTPATVYSLVGCPAAPEPCYVPLSERGNLPGLDYAVAVVPVGQDGTTLTPEDFASTAGSANKGTLKYNLFSPERIYGIGINANFEISPSVELFTEWTYSKRDIPAIEIPFQIMNGDMASASAVVPASHPFNPFGVAVGIQYRYNETGIFRDFSQTYWRGVFGARGKWKRLEWEVSGSESRDRSSRQGGGRFDYDGLAAALSSQDPAAMLNPFVGDGSAPGSAQLISSLIGPLKQEFRSGLTTVTGFVRGPLLRWRAGEIVGLAGMEYQKNSVYSGNSTPPIDGDTTSRALFAELRVPLLVAEVGGLNKLVLTGAARRESSDRFDESAMTKTIGLEIRPWEKWLLRATYSTAFKPLLAYKTVQPPEISEWVGPDPRFDNEYFLYNAVFGGGVPEALRPETSTSRTVGLVYSASKDWRLSITHWDNLLLDRITGTNPNTIVENEASFPGRVTRDPTTEMITLVDARNINVSRSDLAGVDISIDGRVPTPVGDLWPSVSATYTYRYDEQLTLSSVPQDNLGVNRSTGWAPRWKIVPRVGWEHSNWVYGTLSGRYVSRYRDAMALSTGPNAGQFLQLGDFWQFDLNFDLAIGRKYFSDSNLWSELRLNLGAQNMLNRLPDFCASCDYRGYDTRQYDIRGRTLHAELKLSF